MSDAFPPHLPDGPQELLPIKTPKNSWNQDSSSLPTQDPIDKPSSKLLTLTSHASPSAILIPPWNMLMLPSPATTETQN